MDMFSKDELVFNVFSLLLAHSCVQRFLGGIKHGDALHFGCFPVQTLNRLVTTPFLVLATAVSYIFVSLYIYLCALASFDCSIGFSPSSTFLSSPPSLTCFVLSSPFAGAPPPSCFVPKCPPLPFLCMVMTSASESCPAHLYVPFLVFLHARSVLACSFRLYLFAVALVSSSLHFLPSLSALSLDDFSSCHICCL